MAVWLKRVGVALAALIGVVLVGRGLLVLAAAIVVLVVGAYAGDRYRKRRAVRRFRAVWRSRGKDLLLVVLEQSSLAAACRGDLAPAVGPSSGRAELVRPQYMGTFCFG